MIRVRKAGIVAVLTALCVCLIACGGSPGNGAASTGDDAPAADTEAATGMMPGEDDSVRIEDLDWTVNERVINGSRRVALSYTNNSPFTIMNLRIEFTQREDVTDEERSVFDEAYADPETAPSVEPSELYVAGTNEHFVEPGESADPVSCSLAYAVTPLNMEQFDLMEPSVAEIRYLGGDGKTYLEYYDFLNEAYSLNDSATEDVVTEWPDSELAQMAPTVEAPAIIVDYDDDDEFMFHAYGLDQNSFDPYVEQCQEAGFDVVDYDGDTWYVAADDSGYEVDVSYYDSNDSLCVEVSAPDA